MFWELWVGFKSKRCFIISVLAFYLCSRFPSFRYLFLPQLYQSSNKAMFSFGFCQIHNTTLKEHDMHIFSAAFYCKIIFTPNQSCWGNKFIKIKVGEWEWAVLQTWRQLITVVHLFTFKLSLLIMHVRIAYVILDTLCHTYWTTVRIIM